MKGIVIWTRRVAEPALAVPCVTCGAFIGKPCRTSYAAGDPREPHPDRESLAEHFGFCWAPDPKQATLWEKT